MSRSPLRKLFSNLLLSGGWKNISCNRCYALLSFILVERRSSRDQLPQAVCQSSASQTAAFEVLVELCSQCLPNVEYVCEAITKLFYTGVGKWLHSLWSLRRFLTSAVSQDLAIESLDVLLSSFYMSGPDVSLEHFLSACAAPWAMDILSVCKRISCSPSHIGFALLILFTEDWVRGETVFER